MSYSVLKSGVASFNSMLRNFGVVTVMNAKVYEIPEGYDFATKSAVDVYDDFSAFTKEDHLLCELKYLKIANVTIDGPDKTVTGGQYNNNLIKFGKSGRLEIQDALGNADSIQALGGGVIEHYEDLNVHSDEGNGDVLHVTEDFAGPRLILGDSFFIDQKTGNQVPVVLVFYQVLPDSMFNLSQDAEGDATVFDLNGDLLTTNIVIGNSAGKGIVHGTFYSVLSPNMSATEESKKPVKDETADFNTQMAYTEVDVAGTALVEEIKKPENLGKYSVGELIKTNDDQYYLITSITKTGVTIDAKVDQVTIE